MILFSLGVTENYFGILFVFITTSILSVFSVGGIGVREYIFIVASQTIDISQDMELQLEFYLQYLLQFAVYQDFSSEKSL